MASGSCRQPIHSVCRTEECSGKYRHFQSQCCSPKPPKAGQSLRVCVAQTRRLRDVSPVLSFGASLAGSNCPPEQAHNFMEEPKYFPDIRERLIEQRTSSGSSSSFSCSTTVCRA